MRALDRGTVHVWRLPLRPFIDASTREIGASFDTSSSDAAPLSVLLRRLSPDERTRALRYYRVADRVRFARARGVLRALLASHVDRDPSAIVFTQGAHGKPSAVQADEAGVAFNVSHSGDYALIALTRGREVGVDVEAHREMSDAYDLADRFFSPPEAAALRAWDLAGRDAAFFACWSRKEAFAKATGFGIGSILPKFQVSIDPAVIDVPLTIDASLDDGRAWTLRSLDVADGYSAAVAVDGPPVPPDGWRVTDLPSTACI